jgi:hypothetical protein
MDANGREAAQNSSAGQMDSGLSWFVGKLAAIPKLEFP